MTVKKYLIKRNVFITLIIILVLGYFGWRQLGAKTQQIQYQAALAEKGTLVVTVSASGNISTGNSLAVATTAGGVVNKVYVKNGDSVTQGQILADITLDQNSLQRQTQAWSSYLSAKNSVASANQSKLTAQQNILQDQSDLLTAQQNAEGTDDWDPVSPAKQKIDNARRVAEISLQIDQQKMAMTDTTIAKAQADLTSAWLTYQLAAGQVTAPIAGVVGNLIVAPGVILSSSSSGSSVSSQQLGTVTIPGGRVQAVVNLSQIDVGKVSQNQKVIVTLDAFTGKTFTGRVVLINTNGQVSSGVTNYPATIELDTDSNNIYPNMSANAKIITTIKDGAILIPSVAVQTADGQTTVRILRNGQEETIPVEVGEANDTQTEVISGITEGETVITSIDNASRATPAGSTSPFSLFGGNRSFGGGGGGTVRVGR